MSTLYLIGFIQTLFLSILIITKKKIRLSDIWLTLFILLMGTRLLFIYFTEIGIYVDFPKLIILEFAYWSLFGPVLFLYINTVTSVSEKFKAVYFVHFIPALTVILAFSGYIFGNDDFSLQEYRNSGILYQIGVYVWFYTTHIYFIFSIIKLHHYRKKIKSIFSYKKNVDLKWLLILTYGYGFYLIYSLSYILINKYFSIEIPYFGSHFSWLIMVIYIFLIGFFGFRQRGVFTYSGQSTMETDNSILVYEDNLKEVIKDRRIVPKYAKSRMDEEEKGSILNKLQNHMENEKPYLDPELDIRKLGSEINISPHKISQTINSCLHKNFFEFINEYRVQHARMILEDPKFKHYKIIAIAYDSGFSSKSSFYTIFRKFTSQTPSEYRENHK